MNSATDPISKEREEIAAMLGRHAAMFEAEAARLTKHDRPTTEQVARVLRHMIKAVTVDRPPPLPSSRPFTEQERDGVRVLLDQLFETNSTAASALAAQLGIALTRDLPPPALQLAEGSVVHAQFNGAPVVLRVVRTHIDSEDVAGRTVTFEDAVPTLNRYRLRVRLDLVGV